MLKLAFYIGAQGTFVDKLTAWWTDGPFSHVELVFDSDLIQTCFSSSRREGGVRFKHIDLSDEKWIILPLPETLDISIIINFCASQQGKPYDLWGAIFAAGLDIPIEDKKKWFCTEIIGNALYIGGMTNIKQYFDKFDKIDPNNLYEFINKYLVETINGIQNSNSESGENNRAEPTKD